MAPGTYVVHIHLCRQNPHTRKTNTSKTFEAAAARTAAAAATLDSVSPWALVEATATMNQGKCPEVKLNKSPRKQNEKKMEVNDRIETRF